MKVIFIAGAYLADDWEKIEMNIQKAKKAAIELWDEGWAVICPHLNTAHFDTDGNSPESSYIKGYRSILTRCNAIYMLKGWEMSKGARDEHALAERLGIPILYEDESTVAVTFIENEGNITGTMFKEKDGKDT